MFLMEFSPINFIDNLYYMGVGMLIIIIVMLVIIGVTYLISHIPEKNKKDKNE